MYRIFNDIILGNQFPFWGYFAFYKSVYMTSEPNFGTGITINNMLAWHVFYCPLNLCHYHIFVFYYKALFSRVLLQNIMAANLIFTILLSKNLIKLQNSSSFICEYHNPFLKHFFIYCWCLKKIIDGFL